MDWGAFLALLVKALPLIPMVVTTVHNIAGDSASGATKKKMAIEALQSAVGIADTADPAIAGMTDAFGVAIGGSIDSVVAALKHPTVAVLPPSTPPAKV